MAAEAVSPELRTTIRTARERGVRCLRTTVEDQEHFDEAPLTEEGRGEPGSCVKRTLLLAQATPGLPDTPLDREFQRCVTDVLPKQPPCLVLFRTDQCENVEGCRWLLVVWLPATAREADRAACVRSRGLLTYLVPQPYFLRELFSCGPHELTWRAACEAWSRGKEVLPARTQPPRTPAVGSAKGPAGPAAPLMRGPALMGLLGRLVRHEDPCVRLVLVGSTRVNRGGVIGPTTVEAKVCDSRSPAHLAKAGLPASACYFVMYSREDLAFIHWCPETMATKDTTRIHDDARYAILKAVVIKTVLTAFPEPHPRLLHITARDPQDIVDGVNRATVGDPPPAAQQPRAPGRPAEGERGWPTAGAVADWPDHWPPSATCANFPASLVLPQRPVPPWRGGTRSGTISALASTPHAASHRTKVTRIGTTHFKDLH